MKYSDFAHAFIENRKIMSIHLGKLSNGLVVKPHSHCADVATVHPDAGQQVYRDAPGHISQKINCVLTVPTLPRYSPGSRESKTPVDPWFTMEHLRCSTVEPRFVPVYPGVTQVVYGDVPVTAGCATVTCR